MIIVCCSYLLLVCLLSFSFVPSVFIHMENFCVCASSSTMMLGKSFCEFVNV